MFLKEIGKEEKITPKKPRCAYFISSVYIVYQYPLSPLFIYIPAPNIICYFKRDKHTFVHAVQICYVFHVHGIVFATVPAHRRCSASKKWF